ncbi:MAG TPA: DNA-primase RepB domain-containing protein [Bryobacteraceae bacterium]|nr:DNA-primase RepB domain-containing protein [Bryobacteraceae bacterium]
MILRAWDAATILKSAAWLRYQNRAGRNIFIRPGGEHNLSLIDDLTASTIRSMKETGFDPAIVVETSPGNYQAWLKHSERLDKEFSTAAARALAEKFGGDRGAADWRHFGRLAGFTNRKSKYYVSETGVYPFVRMIEAAGKVYPEADRYLAGLKATLKRAPVDRDRRVPRISAVLVHQRELKTIDVFRTDPRYCGDGNRIDLAYSIYALSHGASDAEVAAAIRSRDLSHKGNERRQSQYIERTIKRALAAFERSL